MWNIVKSKATTWPRPGAVAICIFLLLYYENPGIRLVFKKLTTDQSYPVYISPNNKAPEWNLVARHKKENGDHKESGPISTTCVLLKRSLNTR